MIRRTAVNIMRRTRIQRRSHYQTLPSDLDHFVVTIKKIWKADVLVSQSCLTLCNPMNCMQLTRLLCPWGLSRQEYWSGLPCPSPGNISNPEIKPRSPTLQVESLLSKPPGKSKNTGVQPILSSGDLPDPGIKPRSPALQVDSLPAELSGKPKSYYTLPPPPEKHT